MPGFATTRWSLILNSEPGPAAVRDALEYICRDYRAPVLAFIRRAGHSAADADDLTQEFFARLLERRWYAMADPSLGRFRTYMLAALRRFLMDSHETAVALKRGGGQQKVDFELACESASLASSPSPEQVFTQQWMQTVLEHAVTVLRAEAIEIGKLELFDHLAGFLAESPDPNVYTTLGTKLGIRANTIAVNVHRLRRRLYTLVQQELLQTVADAGSLEQERREFRNALPTSVGPD